ncbi:hypothetical protein AHAS_Ahas15G0384700 [Arachis hypogaea]
MYAKCSDLASARRIFDLIIKKSIFSWTLMIAGYAHSDHPLEALHLFRRLVRTDFRPDPPIDLGSISIAKEMEDYISLNELEFDLQIQTSLIHLYSKCGSIKKAQEVFEEVADKDLTVWSFMINSYAIHGMGKEAIDLFRKMTTTEGIIPDAVVYTSVLLACGDAGLVEDGLKYFLRDALGSTSASLGPLLSACRIHGNVELGELAAVKLLEFSPGSSGNYVLMANLYTSFGACNEKIDRWIMPISSDSYPTIGLEYLSTLSANDGLSGAMRALISEASTVFAHCSSSYIEANMKVESTASELLRADNLKSDLENNKNQFNDTVETLERAAAKLARLEEMKEELEKQIRTTNANIMACRKEQNTTRKRKRDVYVEGKALKAQMDVMKEKVPRLQHEHDLAKENQEEIKAECYGIQLSGQKYRTVEICALDQYRRIPNKKIQNVLKVSFDGLEEFEKEIFLDIACCFNGCELKDVKRILCAHYNVDSLEYGLKVLVEKSLIKMDAYRGIILHALIQDMGRDIVHQESPKKPGKHSRLWILEDIVQGSDKIEMIHMDFPKFEKVIRWDGEAFKKMRNLKTLFIRHTYFSQGPKYLPNWLRVLNWEEYPSPCLPLDFHPEGLVIFQLSGKSIQSVRFLEKQKYMSLTVINLDDSNVEEIPDISGVPNLVNLSLNMCLNLIKIDESIVFLDRLSVLSAQGYTNNFEKVTSARSEVDVEEEQGSPMAPLEAKHSACKLPDLLHESFTTYLTWFRNVEDLDLSEHNFTVLDESLKELCSLRSLSLNGCRELREIKGIPPNIKYFSARNCISLTYASKNMLLNKELHEDGAKDFVLPSSSIPKWVEHSSNNDSISFWFRNKLPEISLCVLVGPAVDLSRTHICPEFIINSSRGQAEHLESVETSNQLVDHIFITDPKLMKSKVNEVILKNEWNHVVCTIKSCGQRGPAIKKLGIYFHKDRSSVANIQFIDPLLHKEELIMGNFQINMQQQKYMASHERRLSLDLPLGMSFSLNDHVSREPNSSVQGPCVDDLCTLRLGLGYIDLPCHASSERDYGSDSTLLSLATQAVLDHPANILAEYSQSPFLAETQNLQAPLFPSSLSGMAIREEFHHKTCCTVLPTTTDDDADDLEMEGFYASLDAETNCSWMLNIAETRLDYLSSLSANDGLSGAMRALISEASTVFAHCSSSYIEARGVWFCP